MDVIVRSIPRPGDLGREVREEDVRWALDQLLHGLGELRVGDVHLEGVGVLHLEVYGGEVDADHNPGAPHCLRCNLQPATGRGPEVYDPVPRLDQPVLLDRLEEFVGGTALVALLPSPLAVVVPARLV